MTELRQQLDHLGLSQYTDAFIAEGFDAWDTLLDIQESDLGYLNVKLGHRRKLQRAIAEARGFAPDRALSGTRKASVDAYYRSDESAAENKDRKAAAAAAPAAGVAGTKRKYRRHPKLDENAPERPASAYVIFSCQVREELKGQDLSFTEIAKTVGERWQVLALEARDTFERQATAAKEKYYADLAGYKKTSLYTQYQEYLADFKAKHAAPRPGMSAVASGSVAVAHSSQEGKRTKLEPQNSASTRSSSQGDAYERSEAGRSPVQGLHDGHGYSLSRSVSSPTVVGSFPPPLQHQVSAVSASSAATYGAAFHSPTRREPYSPSSTSPTSARGYPPHDLPHHGRSIPPGDPRYRESPLSAQSPQMAQGLYWPPMETDPARHSLQASSSPRRTHRLPTSLPPLVHADTTLSSDSNGVHPPLYQGPLLPALDATKAERMLPQPISKVPVGVMSTSPTSQHSPPAGTPNLQQGNQWPALLRATDLARDADMQERHRADKPT